MDLMLLTVTVFVLFLVSFVITYISVLIGLKLFKIQGVNQRQIILFTISSILLEFLLMQTIGIVFLSVFSQIGSKLIAFILNESLMSVSSILVGYALIRYLLKLSGKQLWQLLFFLVLVSFLFSLAYTLLSINLLSLNNA